MKSRAFLAALVLVLSFPGVWAQEVKEVGFFPWHKFKIDRILLSPDGKRLAVSADNDLQLWDVDRSDFIGGFEGYHGPLSSWAFSPDGKQFAAACDEAVVVWSVEGRKRLASFKSGTGEWFGRIAFSPEGKTLAAASNLNVKVWDLATNRERQSFRRLVGASLTQAFSPDLKTLAARNFQEIELWDVESGKLRSVLSEHRGVVCCLEYCSDGKTLLSASRRSQDDIALSIGEVKLWDLATGRERAALNARLNWVTSLALSRDGKTLALIDLKRLRGDSELRVFDFPSGATLHAQGQRPGNAYGDLSRGQTFFHRSRGQDSQAMGGGLPKRLSWSLSRCPWNDGSSAG